MNLGIRELIFLAVLLAVPLASFMYVFQPRNDEIARAREEIDVKRARLDKLDDVLLRIDDIGLAIEAGQESIEMIEAKLPSQQGVEGILGQVEQIAERNALTIPSFRPDSPVPAALYMELPLRLIMEGPFDGFYQFLLELENLPRITRIHQMKLQRMNDPSASRQREEYPPGWMRAEFTLSIYFEPQSSRER